jgi:hypothetical protein
MASPPKNYGRPYDHIDDAAAAALFAIEQQPNVSMQEYMALLVRDADNKYRRSAFQTQNSKMTSSWTGIPDGTPVGTVHNHPRAEKGDRYPRTHFSDTDVGTARDNDERAYITAIDPKAAVNQQRVFDPDTTRTYNAADARERPQIQSAGDELLAQFPIDEQKLMIARRIQASKIPREQKRQMIQRLLNDWPEMQTLFMNALVN